MKKDRNYSMWYFICILVVDTDYEDLERLPIQIDYY